MYAHQVLLIIITVDFFKNQQGWSLTDFKLFELLVYYFNFYVWCVCHRCFCCCNMSTFYVGCVFCLCFWGVKNMLCVGCFMTVRNHTDPELVVLLRFSSKSSSLAHKCDILWRLFLFWCLVLSVESGVGRLLLLLLRWPYVVSGVAGFRMPRLVSCAAARELCCRLQSSDLSRRTCMVEHDRRVPLWPLMLHRYVSGEATDGTGLKMQQEINTWES